MTFNGTFNQAISKKGQWSALILLCGIFMVILAINAWVADDAYITWRTIDNFVGGYGLRWNISERIQTYTHPLWLFVLTVAYYLTRETYYTTIILSIGLATITYGYFIFRIARTYEQALFASVCLFLSKGFVDYSTSGLENSLTHLLLVLWLGSLWGRFRPVATGLTVGLALLNRLDLVFLFLPWIAWQWWHASSKDRWRLLGGGIPLLVWFLFALTYYGFVLPNTALAKLNTDVPRFELYQQGVWYLLDSLQRDPLTLFIISTGLIAALCSRSTVLVVLQAGVLLSLVYIIVIGGDFMSGRFLTPSLIVSLGVLIRTPLVEKRGVVWFIAALALWLGLTNPLAPVYTNQFYDTTTTEIQQAHGIADERAFYFQETGLINVRRQGFPKHPWIKEGIEISGRPSVVIRQSVGFFGFHAGSKVHVLDVYALGDPLLSRLSHLSQRHLNEATLRNWRIGHFRREVPQGYIETLRTGQNKIAEPRLAEYYDLLGLVTQGDLWGRERWLAIWRLHTDNFPVLDEFKKDDLTVLTDNLFYEK